MRGSSHRRARLDAVQEANDLARSSDIRPRLIITADDFGRDPIGTAAIGESLNRGRITAASIMANAACFREACDLVRTLDLRGKIGVHVVLDEGPPVAPQMREFADANGHLCVRRRLRFLERGLASAIEAECGAQVQRVLDAGIRPTHIDSHRHIHTIFPIGRIVVRVAQRFGIRYVRPARNLAMRRATLSAAYKWLFNRYLASRVGTAGYFCDLEDYVDQRYRIPPTSLLELMIHLDGTPRGRSGQALLNAPEFDAFLSSFRLVDHGQAGY
jgi:chitin disaccharide deacetylase